MVQRGRQAQRPRAVPRDVRPHRRRHAAPRRHRAGRVRMRRKTSPPTASCTPRCAWRRSCAPRPACTLDEAVAAMLDGFRQGSDGTDLTIYPICSAMRTAARSREIAELAVRWRDARRGRLRHRRSRRGLPADSPPRRVPVRAAARTSTPPSTPARPSGCRASGRPCSSAAPSASATACASSTTSPGRRARKQLGRLAAYVRDRRIPLELCPTSNLGTGICKTVAEHPIGMLRRCGSASRSTPTTG